MSVKGDWRRPCSIGKEEKVIRNALAWGKITLKHFNKLYNELLDQGKVTRNGRVIRREP